MYLNPQDKNIASKFVQAHKYIPNKETKEWTLDEVSDAHKQRFKGLGVKPISSCEKFCKNEFNSCVKAYYYDQSKLQIYDTVKDYTNCVNKYQKHKLESNIDRSMMLD